MVLPLNTGANECEINRTSILITKLIFMVLMDGGLKRS